MYFFLLLSLLCVEVSQAASVLTRDRFLHDTRGMKIASYHIKPSVNTASKYSDNIYASRNSPGDWILTMRPQLSLESDWNVHSLLFRVDGEFAKYSAYTDENYEDHNLAALAQFDFRGDTWSRIGFNISQKHHDRGSGETNDNNAISPTIYHDMLGSFEFFKKFGRFSLGWNNSIRGLKYENGLSATGLTINNQIRNRTEHLSGLSLNYQASPKYQAYLNKTYKQYDYDNNISRSSNEYSIAAGVKLPVGGDVLGSAELGYFFKEYDDSSFSYIDGVTFAGSALWNVTALTSLRLKLDRFVAETSEDGVAAFMHSEAKIVAEHEIMHNLLFAIGASVELNDYQNTLSDQLSRRDVTQHYDGRVKYIFNDYVSLGAQYVNSKRNSNIDGQGYSANIFVFSTNFSL